MSHKKLTTLSIDELDKLLKIKAEFDLWWKKNTICCCGWIVKIDRFKNEP